MGHDFDLKFVRKECGRNEASALRSLANSEGCYRIYKYGNKGWEGYQTIHYPEEERGIRHCRYCVLVYDRGKIVNIDGLWEKSPLKKRGILGRLFQGRQREKEKGIGEREVAKRETKMCNVCGQSKRSRIWGGCVSGHLICEDCLRHSGRIPIISGRELTCPICKQPLL